MIKHIIGYIRNPYYHVEEQQLTLSILSKLILISYLFVIPFGIPLTVLKHMNLLPVNNTDIVDKSLETLFFATIFAPFLEELLFRFSMKMNKITIAISCSILIPFLLKLFVLSTENIYVFLIAIPIAAIIYYFLSSRDQLCEKLESYWQKNFKVIFYTLSIVFGIGHITNYVEIHYWMYLLIPIITAPQLVMGFVLGYTRMHYGISSSILMHMIINSISFLILR